MGSFHDRKRSICTNCGDMGHHYRSCVAPISSYGIIAFRVMMDNWEQAKALANQDTDVTGIPTQAIQFLMIQRRNSIGYVELLRGKYRLNDIQYIKEQILGTTAEEREQLKTKSFQDLWHELWGTGADNKQYKQEYEQAKVKFESLVTGLVVDGETLSLAALLDSVPVLWKTPEWGFPKGRRSQMETDLTCAMREFGEETGLTPQQYRVFENLEPIRESFFGSNNIHYAHFYYLAWVSAKTDVCYNPQNPHMAQEIGGLGWFSLEAALQKIRPTNVEKREILLRASSLLRNLCPLLVGPVASTAEQWPKHEGGTPNRNRTEDDHGA